MTRPNLKHTERQIEKVRLAIAGALDISWRDALAWDSSAIAGLIDHVAEYLRKRKMS